MNSFLGHNVYNRVLKSLSKPLQIKDGSLYMGGEGTGDKMGGSEIFRKEWGGGSIRSNMNMEGTLIIVTILTTECFIVAFVLVHISSCDNSLQWQSSCLVEKCLF